MSETPPNPGRRPPTGTPRWVKILGIVFILLVLTFIALHLAGIAPTGHMPR